MKLSDLKKDRVLAYSFGASFLALLLSWILAYVNFFKTGNLLIMHFDSYKGTDFLGDKSYLYNVLGAAAVILFLNFWLAGRVYFKERFLSYMLSVFSLILSLLILIAVFVIISIN